MCLVSVVANSIFVFAISYDIGQDKGVWEEAIVALKNFANAGIFIASLIIPPALWLRGLIGVPAKWEMVHELLNVLKQITFRKKHKNAPDFHHRVTLFKAVGFKKFTMMPWFRKNWLVPYDRSGHVTRDSVSCFRISDDPQKAEGVAGKTWVDNQVIEVFDLPEVTSSSRPKEADISYISKKTWISEKAVEELSAKDRSARSYCGVPVENNGKLWGVLVFDSQSAKAIGAAKASLEFQQFANLFGKLVAKG